MAGVCRNSQIAFLPGMTKSWLELMEAWHDFYVIVGSAAAGLTGLMFVVVTLGPHTISSRSHAGVRGFVTPTVVFFATVLVLGAVMTIPSMTANLLSGVLALGSLGGLIYLITIHGHKTWQQSELDWRDWICRRKIETVMKFETAGKQGTPAFIAIGPLDGAASALSQIGRTFRLNVSSNERGKTSRLRRASRRLAMRTCSARERC